MSIGRRTSTCWQSSIAALEQVNREDVVQLQPLLEFLPSWYLEHVEKLDQPYGVWLKCAGVYFESDAHSLSRYLIPLQAKP